jgi:GTP cyclohydrolase IA
MKSEYLNPKEISSSIAESKPDNTLAEKNGYHSNGKQDFDDDAYHAISSNPAGFDDEPIQRSTKTDPELGRRVAQFLIDKGVATPQLKPLYNDEEKRTIIARNFAEIMTALGLDLNDDSLIDTPKRVAQMYVDEIFFGLDVNNFPKCTTVTNKMGYGSMVIERNVNVQSNCEHHFVIIDGKAHVAYIPNKKVLGLSKINRIVEYFAKRPQIQERLTEQVYFALSYILGTEDIAVMIEAQHYCVKSRGVEDVNSDTVTSKLGGEFLNSSATRSEFMRIIQNSSSK